MGARRVCVPLGVGASGSQGRMERITDSPDGQADVSAQEAASRQGTRVPRPHEDGGRPARDRDAAREGPEAAHGPDPIQASGRLTAERLPRTFRLARASEIRALMTQGKRRRTDHLDLFTRPSPVGHSRLAVIVPRHTHTAVLRNQLRRRIKEIGRRDVLPVLGAPTDVGIRARPGAYGVTFDRLRLEIVAALCPSPRASSSC